MKIVRLEEVPSVPVSMEGAEGVCRQLPLSKEDGAPTFSFRVFTVAPGGQTPFHEHGWEHMNYVIAGRGALVDAHGEERKIQNGDFALVLPGEKHCYRNTADDTDLVLLCAVPVEHE